MLEQEVDRGRRSLNDHIEDGLNELGRGSGMQGDDWCYGSGDAAVMLFGIRGKLGGVGGKGAYRHMVLNDVQPWRKREDKLVMQQNSHDGSGCRRRADGKQRRSSTKSMFNASIGVHLAVGCVVDEWLWATGVEPNLGPNADVAWCVDGRRW